MLNQQLSNELIKRILFNLGVFNNQGVLSDSNILNKKLKLAEEDDSIKEYDIWGAECSDTGNLIKCIISNIGINFNDFVVVITQEDFTVAIRCTENNSGEYTGCFFTKYEEKWVDMTILHQLNLASAIELITQNGWVWAPVRNQDGLYNIIASILSEE